MTILPTLIQSVAHPPRRDVTQPAGEAYSSRRTPLAAPIHQSSDGESAIEHTDSEHPSAEHVSPPASQAIFGSVRANIGERHVTASEILTLRLNSSLAAREGEQVAAPFPHPQASSPLAAGNSASSVSDVPPLSFDPAFLAAWRETQYGPNDMDAR